MRIDELSPGLSVTFFVRMGNEELTLESTIQDVIPQKRLALVDVIHQDDKVITFRGQNIVVDALITFENFKPQIFKNISIALMRKSDNSLCYAFTCATESKDYNRRENFRCFVDIPTTMRSEAGGAVHDITIRDVSISGFSIILDEDLNLEMGQQIHVLLTDYIKEVAENFSFHMFGIVVRRQELENGRVLYGCQLRNPVAGLDGYIMKKERVRLKRSNGST